MDVDTMKYKAWFAQIFGNRISAPAQPNERPFRATQNPGRKHKHSIGKTMGTGFRRKFDLFSIGKLGLQVLKYLISTLNDSWV